MLDRQRLVCRRQAEKLNVAYVSYAALQSYSPVIRGVGRVRRLVEFSPVDLRHNFELAIWRRRPIVISNGNSIRLKWFGQDCLRKVVRIDQDHSDLTQPPVLLRRLTLRKRDDQSYSHVANTQTLRSRRVLRFWGW